MEKNNGEMLQQQQQQPRGMMPHSIRSDCAGYVYRSENEMHRCCCCRSLSFLD